MALSGRNLFSSDASFSPLFRLLNDFDDYSRQAGGHQRNGRSGLNTWQPKFDIRETVDNYELHGELPGMNKENVLIDFTDPQTMFISGRIERTYTMGTPPAGQIEGSAMSSSITDGSDGHKSSTDTSVQRKDKEGKKPADDAKYWLAERSIGEFSRSFNFPTRVDQDAVSASLKDGLLSITIPKAKKRDSHRIVVN